MKLFSAAQIREWDQYTIENEPVSSIELMERAALACVNWLESQDYRNQFFHIFCGKGNNGGDGLAIARLLSEKGYDIAVHILELGQEGSPDFEANLRRLQDSSVSIHFIQAESHFTAIDPQTIVIDALFGTGLHRQLEGLSESLVHHINRSGANIISIDIPSGMNADGSSRNQPVIHAEHTLSFQLPKLAFMLAENNASIGKLHLLNICLHPAFYHQTDTNFIALELHDIQWLLRVRDPSSHKGHFGHALLVGGSYGKIGAMVLATTACLRTGCGLATAYVPACGYTVMQSTIPEAMVLTGCSEQELSDIIIDTAKYAAIGLGPGMGTSEHTQAGLLCLLQMMEKPVVLDADALNILSIHQSEMVHLPPGSIITPHPKEFDRLFGEHTNEWERIQTAMKNAKALQLVIVLKGHHTFIALPNGKGYFNTTGNAGLAKGGSGDVLTGMITSFLAQGYTPDEAAMIGVYLHGLAADKAIHSIEEESLLASDVITAIPQAFKDVKLP